MKYKLKTLLRDDEILSHVFLECAETEVLEQIKTKRGWDEKEDMEDVKLEVKLTVDGHNINPKKFFDALYGQYSVQVKRAAMNIVREKTLDTFQALTEKIQDAERVVDSWVGEINWDVENPFNKE